MTTPMLPMPRRHDQIPVAADLGNCRIWAEKALELEEQARIHAEQGSDRSATLASARAQVYATLAASLHLDKPLMSS